MSRSTHCERAQRLNAAFELLARNYPLAEAAAALTEEFGLSRRQAYRYLQAAQGIGTPVAVSAPRMAITLKVPEDVVVKLRAHAQTSGLRLGDIVAYAVLSFLDEARRHG
jgi:predicted DNA-binding transcriptional regulator YafY